MKSIRLVKSDLNAFRTASCAQTALLFYFKLSTCCTESSSITVGVVNAPAWSGEGTYEGVASNYLAQRHNKDEIICFIRTPQSNFELPKDPETPIIMVGPGTGVAPFRGFLQARRVQKQKGINLGQAHLYFGCRHPEKDYLYRTELENDERDGLISLHTAFLV